MALERRTDSSQEGGRSSESGPDGPDKSVELDTWLEGYFDRHGRKVDTRGRPIPGAPSLTQVAARLGPRTRKILRKPARLSPRLALACGDERSLRSWNRQIESASDEQFCRLLTRASEPGAQPDVDELLGLEAPRRRIAEIQSSEDTARQHRLRKALVPTKRGRRAKDVPERDLDRAREARDRVAKVIRLARKATKGASVTDRRRRFHEDVVVPYFSQVPRADQQGIVDLMMQSAKRPSALASKFVRFGIAPNRIRRNS